VEKQGETFSFLHAGNGSKRAKNGGSCFVIFALENVLGG
jgi:hypothetical protein